ncbi:MAG: class I SAM-dependent methyltransferase, partial [Leptolyngbyaceae cyanobacterium bins.59]|nr:class I SAM-dependent methyltransferase [Leptolyngbyaceae cyanobacterium bins.59]
MMQNQENNFGSRGESTVDLETMRQQFDNAPYPAIPLETSPRDDLDALYIHTLVTPFYLRNQQILETRGKVLLDAGCGTGYTSLLLAEANPGARIVGIDLSEKSVELAANRLHHYGFEDVEFHAMSIEDLPQLGLEFDFINCDETLYLLPDPLAGLQAMKAVLKPEGIIRTNLHSSLQRDFCYRAQRVFTLMGLMEGAIEDLQVELTRQFMMALK